MEARVLLRCTVRYELLHLWVFPTFTFENVLVLRDAAQMHGYSNPIWEFQRAKIFLIEAEQQEQFSTWTQCAHEFPQYHLLAFEVIKRLDTKCLRERVGRKGESVGLPTLEAQIWKSFALEGSPLDHPIGDIDADDLTPGANSARKEPARPSFSAREIEDAVLRRELDSIEHPPGKRQMVAFHPLSAPIAGPEVELVT